MLNFVLDHRLAVARTLAVVALILWAALASAGLYSLARIYRRADGPASYGLTILATVGLAAFIASLTAACIGMVGAPAYFLLSR